MAGKIVADTLEHSTAGSVDTQYVVNGSDGRLGQILMEQARRALETVSTFLH